MTNAAAQHMARLSWAHGTTPARQAASRVNGKKGGRPKKNKEKNDEHNIKRSI
jgi:hypothetical protein